VETINRGYVLKNLTKLKKNQKRIREVFKSFLQKRINNSLRDFREKLYNQIASLPDDFGAFRF
jgi:hypothetical protein